MKVLLVHPPFCTPTVPPHSVTCLASFLEANSDMQVRCLDLNAKFHRLRFPALYQRLEKAREGLNPYSEMLAKYANGAKKVHRQNNLNMSAGGSPDFLKELVAMMLAEEPDAVGLSFVYNSQVFYGLRLIEELFKLGIECVAGGPAAGRPVREKVKVLKDGKELLMHLAGTEPRADAYSPDFSCYPAEDYLSKEMIYPLRSSNGCSHGACAFCTHHGDVPYKEIEMASIRNTVLNNRMRNLFFIDDNIPAERLSELAAALGPLGVRWWCQTRPSGELLGRFPALREGGLVSVSYGVESGSQRMLDRMGKGTAVETIERVLGESHQSGIRNIVFIMFGFPGEDEASFRETVDFLRRNRESIDLISSSIFGLQRGSYVYSHPDDFGVFGIRHRDTPLGETVTYRVREGLSEKAAKAMKEEYARELREMNKLPRVFGLLKEQTLFF